MKLIIDAGHGAKDTGAFHGGYMEKDLNLILAKRVRELLKDYNPAMTRTQDIQLDWQQRTNIIRDKYDICLSLHLNAGGGRGVETIHSIYSLRGAEIATSIMEAIHKTGIPKRPNPVYSRKNSSGGDYYYMHRLTGSTTTVIVEALFLDSDLDKLLLNVEKIAQGIADGFRAWAAGNKIGTPQKDNPRVLRKYDSNIHIFETDKNMHVDMDLGQRWKLETVPQIVNSKLQSGAKIFAAINGGFFNFNGSSEHLGLYIDDGLYYTPPSESFVDFIYYKNGKTEIRNMNGYDKVELSRLQSEAHWAIGTSYCLVKDGKTNTMNKEKFDHATVNNPRTMLGQKADGTFILAVADGRSIASKGLDVYQQAQVMLDLGCINAVNLDGGGSSTMVTVENGKAKTVNKPSSGLRPVGSVVIVKEV